MRAVSAIRKSVALFRHPDIELRIVEEEDAVDALELQLPIRLDLREGQFRQTLLLDSEGRPTADVTVGFLDDALLMVSRGPGEVVAASLGDSTEDVAIFGLEGPFAWELLAAWDTPGVIGLPYLGAYRPRDGVLVVRHGFSGEYGYLLFVRPDLADAVWEEVHELLARFEGCVGDLEALSRCSFENWVFEPHRTDLNALELQLTWRVDLTHEGFGIAALRESRERGVQRRVTAMVGEVVPEVGASVDAEGSVVGSVLGVLPSEHGTRILALLDAAYAEAGVRGFSIDGEPCHTVSAPWLLNRSLLVNPQQHAFARREELFPE